MTIEVAMVIGGERGVAIHLACQQSACERYACNDCDLASLGFAEEHLGRTLAKDVVDDLHGHDVRILDGLECLLDLLDRDAVVAKLASRHELIQCVEYLGSVIDLRRWAMQLHQIECIDAQFLAAAIDERFKVRAVVAVRHMRRQTTAGLGGHDRPRSTPFFQHLANDAFGTTVAVNIRGIDERCARF